MNKDYTYLRLLMGITADARQGRDYRARARAKGCPKHLAEMAYSVGLRYQAAGREDDGWDYTRTMLKVWE